MTRQPGRTLGEILLKAGWAPLAVFLAHVFISGVLNGYFFFPPLDIPMHFFGGLAMAYFLTHCFTAVPAEVLPGPHRGLVGFALVTSGTGITAVLWEFAEFLFDRLFHTHAQLGLADTLLDMALGIAGALFWSAVALRRGRLGLVETTPTVRQASDEILP